ncbi:MAG: hypothetical protein R6V67_08515 [Spirochaetia bacterium]
MADSTRIEDLISGYISGKKQFVGDSAALLTVAGMGTFSDRGSLDFGGSEYAEAKVKWLTPQKKADDDTYGWWHLSEGMYIAELNERIKPDTGRPLLLQIWEPAQRAGIVHPSFVIHPEDLRGSGKEPKPLRVTVSVGSNGVDIKENARLSKLVLL